MARTQNTRTPTTAVSAAKGSSFSIRPPLSVCYSDPRNEERRTPRPLDVWQLLPRTNCRQCGELTCMTAFTFGLLEARRHVDECVPLCDESALVPRATLLEMLGNFEVASSVWRMRE